MEFPIEAFCLYGNDGGKIAMAINEAPGFPNRTCVEGGYDIICNLTMDVGCYHVESERYFSATGTLYRFSAELNECYKKLEGIAQYKMLWERDLLFSVEMIGRGHAAIKGTYRDRPDLLNNLEFEMETDQSCFLAVIQSIEKLKDIFGGFEGIEK